jgi:hypothetical protein
VESRIVAAIARKGADLATIAAQVTSRPKTISDLVEGLEAQKPNVKYGCEKVLRRVSERRPDLVMPYFDAFVKLLRSDNSFLKWGAIITLANLAPADRDGRLEQIFARYFAPVTGPGLVTAANTIASAPRIARARPELTQRIVRQILKVETASFVHQGAPSPECRNVACGHAIAAFAAMFDQINRPKPVLEFVKRQLESTRPAVRKSAEKFLRRHATPAGNERPRTQPTTRPVRRHSR